MKVEDFISVEDGDGQTVVVWSEDGDTSTTLVSFWTPGEASKMVEAVRAALRTYDGWA